MRVTDIGSVDSTMMMMMGGGGEGVASHDYLRSTLLWLRSVTSTSCGSVKTLCS